MVQFIILAALEQEFKFNRILHSQVHYTGIGKINAAVRTSELIISLKPKLVINVGTVGALTLNAASASFIRSVIERDMLGMPLAIRGKVPFDSKPNEYFSDKGESKCATGDSFVTSPDSWLVDQEVDYVDMELFAIAKTSYYFGVPWRSIKYVSDFTNDNSVKDWNKSLNKSSRELNTMIDLAIND